MMMMCGHRGAQEYGVCCFHSLSGPFRELRGQINSFLKTVINEVQKLSPSIPNNTSEARIDLKPQTAYSLIRRSS